MNSPKISVIVPIFRAEDTLLRCLDSLKAQTFEDFEVLMIDDGSPDRCGEIMDEYAEKDNRFKAFHKENGGVSSARQFGIDHAIGDYTIHADPDDWVEPTMLEDLYNKAKKEDSDMVICDFYIETYKGQEYVKQQPSALDHLTVQKELFQQLHGSCCNKLVKRACYSEYGVKFPQDITFCEDQYVICAMLMHDIRVSYLPKAFYHYVRDDAESLSRAYSEKTYMMDVKLRESFDQLFSHSPYRESVYQSKTKAIVSRAFWGGKNVFSSRQFRQLFFAKRQMVMQSSSPFYERLLITFACYGFYQQIRKFTSFLMKLKRL